MFCPGYFVLFLCGFLPSSEANIRHYYLAAVEVEWDYTPSGRNLFNDETYEAREKLERRVDRIGHAYRKVIYRGFTDATFSTPLPVPDWAGIVGPPLKAEIGDEMHIHFKNMAKASAFSVHPHGVVYSKRGEGAFYIDNTGGVDKLDDAVPPGGAITYVWSADHIHAQTKDDDNCVAWGYHSHTMSSEDIDTGLMGFVLVCRPGTLGPDGHRLDVDKEFYVYSDIADESESWLFDVNIQRCGNPKLCQYLRETEDTQYPEGGFMESNRMHHINGYSFGNLPDFVASAGDRIAWYFMTLNSGMFAMHINGQSMILESRRVDTILLHPASFYSGYMIPRHPGRWALYSRNNEQLAGGCTGFLLVTEPKHPLPPIVPRFTRKYFLAIEEVVWDYGQGVNPQAWPSAGTFLARGRDRIGSVYKKAVYREYLDDTFTTPVKRGPFEKHYGLAGPPIKAEVGERVVVVVLNRANRPYSFLANGVSMPKHEEGAFYKLSPKDPGPSGKIVGPGKMMVYTFDVLDTDGPTKLNPDCITYVYNSAVQIRRDISTGLFGPLLVCKPGTLTIDNKQKHFAREFFLNWQVLDENYSWYIEENILAFTDPKAVNMLDAYFRQGNRIRAINGFTFGSLPGLNMCMGEHVSWHMYGLGATADHHSFSFESNNFFYDGRRMDTAVVFPGTGATVTMVPDQAGHHLLRAGQLGHESEGMFASYTVELCKGLPVAPPPAIPGVVRRIYIGIVEVDWDYCPVKIEPGFGQSLLDPRQTGFKYVRNDKGFVGSIYKKAVYREFTDESFAKMKPRMPEEEHLALMGPFIRGNVGDTLEIVLKNFASFPYNLVPRMLPFADGSPVTNAMPTLPGHVQMYRYYIPARSGPLKHEPNCVGSFYTSRVSPVNDTFSGLFGTIVICKPGIVDMKGRRTDNIAREFATSFVIIDENLSHYNGFNFATRAPHRLNYSETDFVESNRYYTINGLIYQNLHGLVVHQGENSAWYVYALGSDRDAHTVHFHGQLYLRSTSVTLKRDVLEVFSGTYETVEMQAYNPGTWMYHCHVGRHTREGMKTVFTILPPVPPHGDVQLPPPAGKLKLPPHGNMEH